MWSQHIVSLYITDICLPEVLCFLGVDMNYLKIRLCELGKSLGAPVFGFSWTILTFVVVSILFTVSLIFQTSSRVARGVCDSWRRLKFKLFYSALFFLPGWGCDLIWASTVTLHFFSHSVCWNAVPPPLYFEPKPNLSKTLKGLLIRLVIFLNTIFQLKSLHITVSVCYVSRWKVNRKKRSRPSLFVWFCVPPC